MLGCLGDVTEPFHVNYSMYRKKNLYRLLLCGRGVGQNMNVAGGSGTS